jgi:hypothetical protein
LPLAAVALMAMLTGCGEVTGITNPTPGDTSPPQMPTGMTVTYNEGGQAFLTWDFSASPNVVGTYVYLYSAPNSYAEVNDLNPADNLLPLPTVDTLTTITYRLRSLNKNGVYSAYTNDYVVTLAPRSSNAGGAFQID